MENFIDENIKIDFKIPKYIMYDIEALEKAIKENSLSIDCYILSLDSSIKSCLVNGVITKEQEQILRKKYKV